MSKPVKPIRHSVLQFVLPIAIAIFSATGLPEIYSAPFSGAAPHSKVSVLATGFSKLTVSEDTSLDLETTGERDLPGDLHIENLREQLIRHEGLSLRPYEDIDGGITIGVGRHLSSVGITYKEALILLEYDIARVMKEVHTRWPWVDRLSPARRAVLYNMAFNMGIHRLSSFKRMLTALKEHLYEKAAREMLDSRWATQVGARAGELADQLIEDRFRT